MREFIGAVIVVNGIALGIYMIREKSVDWKGFLAVTAVSVLAGVIVANLPYVTQFVLSGGKGPGVTVNIQRQVEHIDIKAKEVEATAAEVKDIKEQVKLLVQNANTTNDKITASEKNVSKLVSDAERTKTQIQEINRQAADAVIAVRAMETNVSQMRDNVRQTWRSLFESYAFAIGTRNIFPIPQAVATQIDHHLNILATFAYPDAAERNREIQRIMAQIQAVQPH